MNRLKWSNGVFQPWPEFSAETLRLAGQVVYT
jgi:hypothetical protein